MQRNYQADRLEQEVDDVTDFYDAEDFINENVIEIQNLFSERLGIPALKLPKSN